MSQTPKLSKEDQVALTSQILLRLFQYWKPHPAQARILFKIFYEDYKTVFVECGRKFGKTELAVYFLLRIALTTPYAACYYVAHELKQAREILWSNKRIHRMIPPEFIKATNNTEMRITLMNDSFIKLDGSENSEAARGFSPHALVYDEYKDHDPNYHVAMNPNRAVYNAPLLVIGTPPEQEGTATRMKNDFLSGAFTTYFNFPSWENPHIPRQWFEDEKKRLIARGEEDIWYREYEAKFVFGGKNSIFPMLRPEKHKFEPHIIDAEIAGDKHKLQYYVVADPGSTSIFAVLFAAYNPYTKVWYMFDEIYETDQQETSVGRIIPRIAATTTAINPLAKWSYIYDEAAAWFFTEAVSPGKNQFPVYGWTPTNKIAARKDPMTKEPWGVSLIKDILNADKLKISTKCEKLWWELANYARIKNRRGDIKILKKNDHLIDCFRYALEYTGFSLKEQDRPVDPDRVRRKVYSIEDDIRSENNWMIHGGWFKDGK